MRSTCGVHVVWRHFVPEPSTSFSYVSWSVLWLCPQFVIDVTAWLMNPNPSCSKNRKLKEKEKKSKIKMKSENKIKSTINDLDICYVRHSLCWGGSLWNGLGNEQTCGMTLASAYVLCHLSATWSQLQMIERSLRWKWVLIGMSLLNTGDRVQ